MLIAAGFQGDKDAAPHAVTDWWLKKSLRGKWMPILEVKGKSFQHGIAHRETLSRGVYRPTTLLLNN